MNTDINVVIEFIDFLALELMLEIKFYKQMQIEGLNLAQNSEKERQKLEIVKSLLVYKKDLEENPSLYDIHSKEGFEMIKIVSLLAEHTTMDIGSLLEYLAKFVEIELTKNNSRK